jgi:hypothetical protein
MNQITNVMKMHFRDKLNWIYVPWIYVLFFSFLVNIIIAFLLGGKTEIYTGGIASIYFYMLIAGGVIIRETFSFVVGLSVRRKDYFWGTLVFVALASALSAILLFLLSFLENQTNSWGVNLHFFDLPYLNDGGAVAQIWVNFVMLMFLYFLGFVLASVYRRVGPKGLLVVSIVTLLLLSVGAILCTYYGWWWASFAWVSQYTAFELAWWLTPIVVIFIFLSFLLLRRATV